MAAQTTERAWLLPVAYGLMHAVVDAASVVAVFAAIGVHRLAAPHAFGLVVGYDVLAFATQAALGAATDRLGKPKLAVLVGLGLIALATLLMPVAALPTAVLAGLGNACFHVGAGAICLRVAPTRAAAPGLFVAPGALGLGLGLWLGRGAHAVAWPWTLALLGAILATVRLPGAAHAHDLRTDPALGPQMAALRARIKAPRLLVGLLLCSVLVRSLVGFAGSYRCPKLPIVLLALSLAAFAGKAVGGALADRLGWIHTSVAALLLSAPLVAFGAERWLVVVAGMFLFQMTMPVTLTAVTLLHPGRPAFAFGLTCLALIAGAIPTFVPATQAIYGPGLFVGLIVLSAAALYAGLRMLGVAKPV
jgi:MFS transporter, FSR family, fosmidomycin resistance protein